MSDFSDRPLVAGSLIGLRSFGVDNLGRLHGPSFDQVFRPGENVADCRKREGDALMWGPMTLTFASVYGRTPWSVSADPEPEPEPEVKVEKPKHSAGIMDCTCGFYAYFDGRNDYKDPTRVAVLIEGFGVCTVGSRGFRAQKARPVALVVPGKKFPEGRFQLVLRNYPDVPVYATKAAALDAHPLTPPDVPGPDSPGFWDRPVKA